VYVCATNRAAVHYEKGDYETAIADCEEAVTRGRELRAEYTLVAK
jgi:stress-induced-phosphoprotein 1